MPFEKQSFFILNQKRFRKYTNAVPETYEANVIENKSLFCHFRKYSLFSKKISKNEKIFFCIFSFFESKTFRKHSDTITKTSKAISNENENFHFFILMIFHIFSIVHVTVDLDTQTCSV